MIFAGKKSSAVVTIILHPNLQYRFIGEEVDIDGRFLLVEGEIDEQRFVFCSVFMHQIIRYPGKSLSRTYRFVLETSQESVGCDYNTTIDLNEENSDRKGDNTKKSLQNFADNMRLTETWEYALDQEKRFSRKGPDSSETQIDSVLIEKIAENQVKYLGREYLTDGNRRLSDHA